MTTGMRTLEEIDSDLRESTDHVRTEALLDERSVVMHAEEKKDQ